MIVTCKFSAEKCALFTQVHIAMYSILHCIHCITIIKLVSGLLLQLNLGLLLWIQWRIDLETIVWRYYYCRENGVLNQLLVVRQPRQVDDRSPGRGGMVQDSQTRGRAFHDEMDSRDRESQGSITACKIMPRRDGKHQGEGSPKQACLYWFARSSQLATVARTM